MKASVGFFVASVMLAATPVLAGSRDGADVFGLCAQTLGEVGNLGDSPIAAAKAIDTINAYPTFRNKEAFQHIQTAPSFIKQLRKGARIFDSGGGFSIYGYQFSLDGFLVTTVNAQDLYKETIEPIASSANLLYLLDDRYGVNFNLPDRKVLGIPDKFLDEIGKAFGITLPASVSRTFPDEPGKWEIEDRQRLPEDLALYAQGILSKIKLQERNNSLLRKIGNVQEVLQAEPDASFQMLIDLFGAFYYSSDRLSLASLFLRKLAPGGRGFVSYDKIEDIVEYQEDGVFKTMKFAKFLAWKFPDFFEFYESQNNEELDNLILKRPVEPMAIPDFFQYFVVPDQHSYSFFTHQINLPKVIYRVRGS